MGISFRSVLHLSLFFYSRVKISIWASPDVPMIGLVFSKIQKKSFELFEAFLCLFWIFCRPHLSFVGSSFVVPSFVIFVQRKIYKIVKKMVSWSCLFGNQGEIHEKKSVCRVMVCLFLELCPTSFVLTCCAMFMDTS